MPRPMTVADTGRVPGLDVGVLRRPPQRLRLRGAGRQLAGRARAGRRRRLRSRRGTTRCTRSSPRSRPALAAGCTVVVKPSEVAPLTRFMLAEIVDAAGLPPGVFNFVTGYGPVVGEAIAAHPDVDMVSFTGSTRAGKAGRASSRRRPSSGRARARRQVAERHPRRRRLREGGPHRRRRQLHQLRPDLRRVDAHAGAARAARRGDADREGRGREASRSAIPVGDRAQLGPLVSATQRDRVRGYIQKGIAEGATLVTGGAEPPDRARPRATTSARPCSPTSSDMTIAQEEIFGPVLSIIPYDDEDDAVRIANDTIYGLGGASGRGDAERAKRVARRMRTGQVDINGARLQPARAVRRLQAVGRRPRARQATGSRSTSSRRRCRSAWSRCRSSSPAHDRGQHRPYGRPRHRRRRSTDEEITTMTRIPLPPFPNGWFSLCYADEVGVGEVRADPRARPRARRLSRRGRQGARARRVLRPPRRPPRSRRQRRRLGDPLPVPRLVLGRRERPLRRDPVREEDPAQGGDAGVAAARAERPPLRLPPRRRRGAGLGAGPHLRDRRPRTITATTPASGSSARTRRR